MCLSTEDINALAALDVARQIQATNDPAEKQRLGEVLLTLERVALLMSSSRLKVCPPASSPNPNIIHNL
jgi:hypothetical protein